MTELNERPELNVQAALEAIPLGVELHEDIDLDALDPALVLDGDNAGRRLCVAATKAGGRCSAPPGLDTLVCSAHAGKLDSSLGGRTAAAKRRERRMSAEERAALARLGVRAAIAQRLQSRNADVVRTVDVLLDAASGGDLKSAQLLLPYLNQGLGMPTERHEQVRISDPAQLDRASTAELEALVAEGRERRLHAVQDDAADAA